MQPQRDRPSLRANNVVYNVRALGQVWRCAPKRARDSPLRNAVHR